MEFNIADLVESLADAIPDRTAVVSGDFRMTHRELEARANRVANYLRSRGVKPGDHVGLHLYNGHQYVECMLGVLKLRGVHINLNYRYSAPETRYLCENADLVAVIGQRELSPILGDAAKGLAKIHTVLIVDDGSKVEVPKSLNAVDYEEALASASAARDFGKRSGDDLYIVYTGGTTGMPKGVMWRQEDLLFAALQGGNPGGDPIERPEDLAKNAREEGASMLSCAPFIHGAAQYTAWISFFGGSKVVIQPGKSFDPKHVAELIEREGVNTIQLVGDAMALPLAETIGGGSYDVGSIFVVASAGAVLSPSVKEKLEAVFPDVMIVNSFGSTETGHQGSAMPGSESGREGRPSFEMDATNTVLDDDLKPLVPGDGRIGRLARSGRVPVGYYKDEEKTRERFVVVDGVRWVLPGDFATIEEDGRITVYGRGANCINTGGEKVFPEEVEEALKGHPDVYDALVIGVEDPRWMQRVVAVVQPRNDARPSLEELQAHCRSVIAGYKVPRELFLVGKCGRMPSGKPDYPWAKQVAKGEIPAL